MEDYDESVWMGPIELNFFQPFSSLKLVIISLGSIPRDVIPKLVAEELCV